jgi:hypothetical protein
MAKEGKDIKDRSSVTISGQKGRPQARPTTRISSTKAPATRPQARPGRKDGSTKTAASPSSLRVSGATKGATTRPQARPERSAPTTSTRPRSRTESGQEPFQSTRDALASRRTSPNARPQTRPQARPERNTSAPTRPENRPKARPDNLVTIAQWRRLSREERRAMGLPLSEIGAQAYFRRLQAGLGE